MIVTITRYTHLVKLMESCGLLSYAEVQKRLEAVKKAKASRYTHPEKERR